MEVSFMARSRYVRVAPKPRVIAQPVIDLSTLRKAELVALAVSRGLDSSGTVSELRDRLGKP